MKAPKLDNVRRILVCQLRQIGDVLLATPSIELLHRRFPQAEIDVLTEIKCAPVLENNPHIHAIRRLDKSRFSTWLHELPWYWDLARDGYDLLVDFQQLPRCRWVAAFSDAPVRLTYTPRWWKRWMYTHYTDPLPGYAARTKASILRPLGIEWHNEMPRLWLRPEEKDDAAQKLAQAGLTPAQRLITVDATHKDPERRWPARQYAELIAALSHCEPDLRFLLLYGPGEKPQTDAVREASPDPSVFITPPPTTSLRVVASYISQAALHIGNCSAPRHMAVALGVPSVIFSCSSGPEWACPLPQHVDISDPPGESCRLASEPERYRLVMHACDAVLEQLRHCGKR